MSEGPILAHAAKILNERQDEYGDPVELLTTIADRWSITADSDDRAHVLRSDAAQRSDLIARR